ncbi:hypothetical protein [Agriterribacter sp.]|uniref:hypothetical protein n=1 Tax=Agriterribacter sp. TaxID=2821509 RepID=UPI002C1F3CB3|nr:hypothetical protein [Agriterribacter sp.]HRP55343.1 hypothetical protein [Agriterribacter sp.]
MYNEDVEPVPPQDTGKKTDIEAHVEATDPGEAHRIFVEAKRRLLDINHWSDISSGISASFALTDCRGMIKKCSPEVGDYLRIDIPGPGTAAGDGFDWVRIEMIEEEPDYLGTREFIVMRVRPAPQPEQKKPTAHFFEEDATSSFIVRREDRRIAAEVHGRNEKPNTGNASLTDAIRNTVVSMVAQAGFSKIQWEKLVKGILNIQP